VRLRTAAFIWVVALAIQHATAQQPASAPSQAPGKALSIAAIFAEGGLTGRGPETVKWSPDGKRVSYVLRDDSGERGELYYIDLTAGKPAVLVAAEKLAGLAPPSSQITDERERERRARYSVAGYHWSPDSKQLLFDSRGQLWLYSLENGTAVQLTSSSDPSGDPKFSPDGKRLAYLRKHNLYLRPISGDGQETQLTQGASGTPGHANIHVSSKDESQPGAPAPDDILNGEVDWVYSEELGVRSNYFWSPDSRQIAYLQMDETKVPAYPIEDFIPTHATVEQQKYPKAGDPNPAVRVGVVNSGGGKTRWITLAGAAAKSGDKAGDKAGDKTGDNDLYIPRFGWVRAGLLYIEVLNRAQDELDLYFADAESGRSRLVLTESSKVWVDVNDDFRVLASGDKFLWSSWRDGHTHLYLYSFDKANPLAADARLERQLTRGEWDVEDVRGVDEKNGLVYYSSTQPDARQRQLWRVPLQGGEPVRISREAGTHAALFPENAGDYYVDTFSALLTPPRMSLCHVGAIGAAAAANCTTVWESRSVEPYGLLRPEFVDFTADDGTTLYGLLLQPPPNAIGTSGKAPLILAPYGGPGVQLVRDNWGGTTFLFHQIMARHGFAILQLDNRGMAGRGQHFAGALRRNFGQIELHDQITALTQALQKYPQLDRNRLGWWGWSYGGYMTLFGLTHSDMFKAGVAVAPVTDWRNYDSIYTERYMGLPQDNAENYRRSSPVNFAADLKGRVLIVHGTSDDNVHMQNTVQMTNSLINAGVKFDLMLYPRKTHGIAGAPARTDLFTRIEDHFERWLLRNGQP